MRCERSSIGFKDSTMRLRDAALSVEDYYLWKSHELENVDPTSVCSWDDSNQLLEDALFLAPENMLAFDDFQITG